MREATAHCCRSLTRSQMPGWIQTILSWQFSSGAPEENYKKNIKSKYMKSCILIFNFLSWFWGNFRLKCSYCPHLLLTVHTVSWPKMAELQRFPELVSAATGLPEAVGDQFPCELMLAAIGQPEALGRLQGFQRRISSPWNWS